MIGFGPGLTKTVPARSRVHATEAASCGAAGATLLALLYRRLTWDALRNASDQFFEWQAPDPATTTEGPKPEAAKPDVETETEAAEPEAAEPEAAGDKPAPPKSSGAAHQPRTDADINETGSLFDL